MNFEQIVSLILSLAPAGVTLTQEVVAVVKEIEAILAILPTQHQTAVANVAAKALLTKA
jgi:hypothetical protein